MSFSQQDAVWMRRALNLAAKGFTPPNPMVGCVLIKDGEVVGEGYHYVAGGPHAEIEALNAAGSMARGSTAYVTLEPCCHYGKTPPCTKALIEAKVARVVVAAEDVNPLVSGRGIEELRKHGVVVDTGLLEAESRELNRAFEHFHTTGAPYVTIKSASTLDGKIATRTGKSQWISGPRSRAHVHRLRAKSGAVMVGIGTVLADNPMLTARTKPGSPRQPLRVIVDSRLRTPVDSNAVSITSARQPLLIATTHDAEHSAERKLNRDGLEILRLPALEGRVNLKVLMAELAGRQIISVLAEGGGELNGSLLASGLANHLLLFVSPLVFGGRTAPTFVEGEGVDDVGDAIRLTDIRVKRFGADIAIDGQVGP
jgi:diaminohydroxyphosphoribosylaminopyrimidine deaminase/5-amino-6-(5-phosphoribosylamino)uracil reductase